MEQPQTRCVGIPRNKLVFEGTRNKATLNCKVGLGGRMKTMHGTHAGKQAGRQAGRQAGSRQAGSRQAGKLASKQASKQAGRQAGKQASRQAGRQAGSRQAGSRPINLWFGGFLKRTVCNYGCSVRLQRRRGWFPRIRLQRYDGFRPAPEPVRRPAWRSPNRGPKPEAPL